MALRLNNPGLVASTVIAVLATVVVAAEVATTAPAVIASVPTAHPTVVRAHALPPRVLTGVADHAGRPTAIACGTCHATRPPNAANHASADLDLFHQGLQFAHGANNTCLSCHNPGDYDSLRLADGRRVEFIDSMQLCSQCHGPQRRDWDHGAHGGMNGYWDLSKGGRVRNACIQCHDPHVPKYQGAIPMLPPRDRFLVHARESGHE